MWVEHPLSMAASLCFEFNVGGIKVLELQKYTLDLNNCALLKLINSVLLFALSCFHLFL